MHRSYSFPGPELKTAAIELSAGILATSVFGAIATLSWFHRLPLFGLDRVDAPLGVRALVAGTSFVACVLGLLVAARAMQRGSLAIARRSGLLKHERSVGSFRLVTQSAGDWALSLDVEGPALHFPLDEATAAELARLFDPTELLMVEWIDVPDEAGGPVILTLVSVEDETSGERQAA